MFANFTGGLGIILGPTGGYLLGFILMPLVYYLFNKIAKGKLIIQIIGLIISLLVLYLFGSIWFYFIYLNEGNDISFYGVLSYCVIPFIIPDLIKLALAVLMGNRINKIKIIMDFKEIKEN